MMMLEFFSARGESSPIPDHRISFPTRRARVGCFPAPLNSILPYHSMRHRFRPTGLSMPLQTKAGGSSSCFRPKISVAPSRIVCNNQLRNRQIPLHPSRRQPMQKIRRAGDLLVAPKFCRSRDGFIGNRPIRGLKRVCATWKSPMRSGRIVIEKWWLSGLRILQRLI